MPQKKVVLPRLKIANTEIDSIDIFNFLVVRKDGRQAEKGQTSNDLVPGFERMDQAGHCWCITTGDRSGKMAKNHQSHSSADSAT